MYTTLIDVPTLAAGLDRRWAIVDCRYDLRNPEWGHAQYLAGHVPGAVYASLSHDLSAAPDGRNGRHPLPTPAAMAATFGRLGIGPGTQVVAYDQDAGAFASRLWWMLRHMGHDAVAVLDGGWARWQAEGRPVATGEDTRPPAPFTGTPRDGERLDAAAVERLLGDAATRLVDARAADRFEGRNETLDPAAGHIPGADNLPYMGNTAVNGTMLPVDQLRARFAPLLAGRTTDQLVMYCGSGVTACHNLLALAHAGLGRARLYPGSWSEWSSDPARPTETGPARRRD